MKYSILIPTRNGINYLPYAIATVLNQSEHDFEVIVSDNHSSDSTWSYLQTVDDTRLRCIQPPYAMSMTRHWEFLLSQAKGDWVALIGDDDGLQPYFFEYCNLHLENYKNIEVISSPRAYYFWKGSEITSNGSVVSYLVHPNKSKLKSFLSSRMAMIFQKKLYVELPQLYTGTLVKKTTLDLIRKRQGGVIFNSITPDANSLTVLQIHCKNYLYTQLPLGWVGTSPKSTGFSSSVGTSSVSKPKDDFKNLNLNDNVLIHEDFPHLMKIFNSQLFYLESWFKSYELYPDNFSKFFVNKPFRFLSFVKFYSEVRNSMSNHINQHVDDLIRKQRLNPTLLLLFSRIFSAIERVNSLVLRAKKILLNRLGFRERKFLIHSKSFDQFPNILAASSDVQKFYDAHRHLILTNKYVNNL